jgi:hypothetical protein
MDERDKTGQHYDECSGPGGHRDHLCNLMDRGLTGEVRRRSTNPAFFCANCGARGNQEEDLCNPEPLPPS